MSASYERTVCEHTPSRVSVIGVFKLGYSLQSHDEDV
jgi:hypothetical protein